MIHVAATAFAMPSTDNVSLTGSLEAGYGTDDTAHAYGEAQSQGRFLSGCAISALGQERTIQLGGWYVR